MLPEKIDMNSISTEEPKDQPIKGLMQQFNHQNIFDIDTSNFKWSTLREMFDANPNGQYKILGLFTNKGGKYGTEPVAIIDGFLVNLPRHLLDAVQQMLDSDEIVQYIKDGHVAFTIYQYHSSKYNRDAYSIEWLDI